MATIHDAIMDMYLNVNDDVDITFLVRGTEIKAHRCILSARSDVLRAMFNFHHQPADGRYRIDDPEISPDTFKEFIKFLYLDECKIDFGNLPSLLHMGEMYNVSFLKRACLKFVKRRYSSMDDVIMIGELGILYENETPELLRCCFEALAAYSFESLSFFYVHEDGRMETAAEELIKRIAKDCPRTMLFNENELLIEIFHWAEKVCIQVYGDANARGIKEVLSGIVEFLKLDKIAGKNIMRYIHQYDLLPSNEYVQAVAARFKNKNHTS